MSLVVDRGPIFCRELFRVLSEVPGVDRDTIPPNIVLSKLILNSVITDEWALSLFEEGEDPKILDLLVIMASKCHPSHVFNSDESVIVYNRGLAERSGS